MRFPLFVAALLALAISTAPAAHAGHGLFDHQPPSFSPQPAPDPTFRQGGENAEWELVGTIPTGNPHTDIDFFTRGGETYAAVGTLAIGPNGGGQTIVQLTQGGEVDPKFVAGHPSAACISRPDAALSLQHDVEASPKNPDLLLNTFNPFVRGRDAEVLIDATDAAGRCHDQGMALGLDGVPGGLEIIDITDPANPKEIGLTSHVGEAHTVNVDPKRPHIAYAVTSDSTGINAEGVRSNETDESNDLDGFEVVDFSSCMGFLPGTSVDDKRARCKPEVFRYRYPTVGMARGHTNKGSMYGCHELEVYPDDRLTCGSGQALIVLDMKGAFDDRGTPNDFTDDKPRGTPLPCAVRETSSPAPLATGAFVTDCVKDGELTVTNWLKAGAPSLEGVRHLGSAFHMGRTATNQAPAFDSSEDIDFDHEAELTHSGNFLLATDERGGGVAPPGAACSPGVDNPIGNGGIHAYRIGALQQSTPGTPDEAFASYAKNSEGGKAIYRAPVNTVPQASICTAHVFQQIPGQNRIFMGWYSQGTQVVDYTENADGTIDFKQAAYFLPANANQWVSHVFKAQQNPEGTFTYWGATGDFNVGAGGRNAIDVYKVTLPAPPSPADGPGVVPRGTTTTGPDGRQVPVTPSTGAPACKATVGLRGVAATPRGRGLRLRASGEALRIDLFQQSRGRRITGERRVARLTGSRTVRRSLPDGYYFVRFRARTPDGRTDVRRIALRRVNGRFRRASAYDRRDRCTRLRSFKIERPVFGGPTNRALNFAFRFGQDTRATVVVRDPRGRVVRRYAARTYRAGTLNRRRVSVTRRFRRGTYRVTITGGGVTETLRSRRL